MSAHFGSDPWLDARLRNVPLPVGMLDRLSQVGSVSNDELDAALCDVPLPPGLIGRLERIARAPRRRVAWREMALAASVLVAVSLAYLALVSNFLSATYPPETRGPLVATQQVEPSDGFDSAESIVLDTAPTTVEVGPLPDPELPPFAPETMLVSPDLGPLPLPGQLRPRAVRPGRDSLFAKAADSASDHLPPLEAVAAPVNRGLPTPAVGYDLLSHLKTGERSFVSPAAHPALSSTFMPLEHNAAGYRLVERYLLGGRLPPVDLVHTEDFLAAVSEQYPSAENPLVLRTAAGPAPFGELGLRLLQINVQAGHLAQADRAATDLTIAVDTSGSMRHGRRLETVQRAVRRFSAELRASDRVTLVAFSDQAELLVDHLRVEDRAAAERLLAAVEALRAEGGTNVGAGIELAGATIRRAAEPGRKQRLIVLSDGLADLASEPAAQAAGLAHGLALEGVKVDVVDLSGERDVANTLSELAAAGEGRAVRAGDVGQITSALSDALAGAPQVVAHSTSLKVMFNPQVVHAYRIVGHAATTVTGPTSAATQVDLQPGEVAGGLIELWLKPDGGDDVATAELSWHDPASATPRQMVQRISRLQFARSFAESPVSLQAAAIAAEAARLLRSPTAAPGHAPARLLELAGQVHPKLRESDSFGQLLELVVQSEKIRGGGAAPRRASAGHP